MKGLSPVQVEQLKQIGDYLLQVRETQGVSLEKVAKDTFIPLRLLHALEIGETDRLPEPVYIKGFIRRYADTLGLDGAEIADTFDVNATPVPQAPVKAEAITSQSEPAVAAASPPAYQQSSDRSKRGGFPTAGYVALGVAAVAILGTIAFKPLANTLTASQSTPTTDTSNNSQSSPTGSAPNAAVVAPAAKPPQAASVQVDVSLTDRSWMEVVVDGKTQFEGILEKGTQRTWKAKNKLQIRAGNAGAVIASHNQEQAKPLGQIGDVVDVNFSSKNETTRSGSAPQ